MSLSFTFGSFGDLVPVGQIAFSIAKVLSNEHVSAIEYKDPLTQLKLPDQIMLQVTLIVEVGRISPELVALCTLTREVAKDREGV